MTLILGALLVDQFGYSPWWIVAMGIVYFLERWEFFSLRQLIKEG